MGDIRIAAQFEQRPTQEQSLVKAFLHNFSLTWYREYNRHGTILSAYLLKPDECFTDTGYAEEILLAYSPYPSIEPRVLRLSEEIFADPDLQGRVEPYALFLVSDATDAREKFEEIGGSFLATRTPLIFPSAELITNKHNPWYIRQRFIERIASRDLFDVRLPLLDEFGFFGRKEILTTIVDSIRRSENVGIFGLRKVGKTSVLFRARDICLTQNIASVCYIDCKSPDVWSLTWDALLRRIIYDVKKEKPALNQFQNTNDVVSAFRSLINESTRRIVLIFDEVEFISPSSPTQNQWQSGFVPFWQTIWSVQSETKKLSIILAGVDSSLLERSFIGKIQNPLFSIVKPVYLHGLNEIDLRSMVRILGRKIGLSIDFEPAMWLFSRYGGHPLLTRLACSVLHNYIKEKKENRPFSLTARYLETCAEFMDSGILYYSEHVVSSLRDAFASEFKLLESLALSRKTEFCDQVKNPSTARHLFDYGLVRKSNDGGYEIAIKIVGDYLITNHAREVARPISKWIVPTRQRGNWIRERKYRILKDFRSLHQLHQAKGINLFGPVILPETDIFTQTAQVNSEHEWQLFINSANRTFVESIEQYGKSLGKCDYFWKDIKNSIPSVWHALNRIKLYRNDQMHLVLRGVVLNDYVKYIKEDLGTTSITTLGNDVYFVLQQGVLDSLLYAIQLDSAKLDH